MNEGEMTMLERRKFIVNSVASLTLAASTVAFAQNRGGVPGDWVATPTKSGFAPVNGLKFYYEIHGAGKPMILIHGGLGAGAMFAPILPQLGKARTVIAVDLQGHGRTADIERPLAFDSMADDIAELAKYLELGKIDAMGYSLGAGVALRTAIRHPEIIDKLVAVSFAFARDGWFPQIRQGMSQISAASAEPMKQTPMYQTYEKLAPRPENWPVLLAKVGDLLRKEYDWSDEIRGIAAPTLLAFGDADAIGPAHAAEFFELMGGGLKDGGWDGSGISKAQLAILPRTTHYTIFSSPLLPTVAAGFLAASEPGKK
jgi:pimeloyl-ACP methyl ester carboxylesterase